MEDAKNKKEETKNNEIVDNEQEDDVESDDVDPNQRSKSVKFLSLYIVDLNSLLNSKNISKIQASLWLGR